MAVRGHPTDQIKPYRQPVRRVNQHQDWTLEEDAFLKAHYVQDGVAYCHAQLPKRTRNSVISRANRIGLGSTSRNPAIATNRNPKSNNPFGHQGIKKLVRKPVRNVKPAPTVRPTPQETGAQAGILRKIKSQRASTTMRGTYGGAPLGGTNEQVEKAQQNYTKLQLSFLPVEGSTPKSLLERGPGECEWPVDVGDQTLYCCAPKVDSKHCAIHSKKGSGGIPAQRTDPTYRPYRGSRSTR